MLATGQRGNPRKLGVPGEEREEVYHTLYSPWKYSGEKILVVGGGNSAVEAALTLSERNRVVLSYRGGEFSRLFKDGARQLDRALAEGRIEAVLHSTVRHFGSGHAMLEVDSGGHRQDREITMSHAFVYRILVDVWLVGILPVTVCPMDTLSYSKSEKSPLPVVPGG